MSEEQMTAFEASLGIIGLLEKTNGEYLNNKTHISRCRAVAVISVKFDKDGNYVKEDCLLSPAADYVFDELGRMEIEHQFNIFAGGASVTKNNKKIDLPYTVETSEKIQCKPKSFDDLFIEYNKKNSSAMKVVGYFFIIGDIFGETKCELDFIKFDKDKYHFV